MNTVCVIISHIAQVDSFTRQENHFTVESARLIQSFHAGTLALRWLCWRGRELSRQKKGVIRGTD